MSDLALALSQTRYSIRGFLRDSRALIFTVIMPVILLLLFNSIFHGTTAFEGLQVPFASYYTASIVAYQVMLSGYGSILIGVTTDRERGMLKRVRGTPMPSWVYLASEIGKTIAVVGVAVVILVVIGSAFYHVHLGLDTLVGLVVYTVVGTASMCALGLAATRLCPTTDSASAFGPFSTVVLAFVSGVFIPSAVLPHWLLDLGKFFPLEHLALGLQQAFVVRNSTGISAENIGVLLAWGVPAIAVAMATFRWEPVAASASA